MLANSVLRLLEDDLKEYHRKLLETLSQEERADHDKISQQLNDALKKAKENGGVKGVVKILGTDEEPYKSLITKSIHYSIEMERRAKKLGIISPIDAVLKVGKAKYLV